jgi:hypothetical protein
MMRMKGLFGLVLSFCASTVFATTTVLYEDRVVTLDAVLADPNDLWVHPADLPKVNGFELKPEGACLDDICVPVKQDGDSELFVTRSGQAWFNVSALSRKLQQEYVQDHDAQVWSFGQLPVTRNRFVDQHIAPDFTINDRQGNPVTLSAFRNKKVLLITWASW